MKNSDKSLNVICIIPTHNRKKELNVLLHQIIEQKDISYLIIDIVVVVDGSNDGTYEMLRDDYPEVHIVEGDGSWWYTKSMNKGFLYAIENLNPEYFLTLNDDVILAEDYFEVLTDLLEQMNEQTIIGTLGITSGDTTRVVTSGNAWNNKCLGIYKNHLPFLQVVNPSKLTGLQNSVTLPGRGMIIPVGIILKLDGFDERFKQYHSDGDFTLRAIDNGYSVKISWDLKIFVDLIKTSGSTSFLNDSLIDLYKSFSSPVSRNYLPAKSLFAWRHGKKICYPFILILFLLVSFKNIYTKKKLSNYDGRISSK